ncbi:hypothetical protein NMG46_11960 [Mesorhizobium sp. LMG 17147]|uniref:hypothetical protein n=1 Tax=Mesorhizobium sp. LMG 17147 TaxID=2963091 RepID=UPI0020C98964|nr:hypothetical protein [Mesorhizobium sp. LMG 17147]MCP9230957.1 hypothetical protein [Mesorhizobium sp. LMG 17147]
MAETSKALDGCSQKQNGPLFSGPFLYQISSLITEPGQVLVLVPGPGLAQGPERVQALPEREPERVLPELAQEPVRLVSSARRALGPELVCWLRAVRQAQVPRYVFQKHNRRQLPG